MGDCQSHGIFSDSYWTSRGWKKVKSDQQALQMIRREIKQMTNAIQRQTSALGVDEAYMRWTAGHILRIKPGAWYYYHRRDRGLPAILLIRDPPK